MKEGRGRRENRAVCAEQASIVPFCRSCGSTRAVFALPIGMGRSHTGSMGFMNSKRPSGRSTRDTFFDIPILVRRALSF